MSAYGKFMLRLIRPALELLPKSPALPEFVEAAVARKGDVLVLRSARQLRPEERASAGKAADALLESAGVKLLLLEPGMTVENLLEAEVKGGGKHGNAEREGA